MPLKVQTAPPLKSSHQCSVGGLSQCVCDRPASVAVRVGMHGGGGSAHGTALQSSHVAYGPPMRATSIMLIPPMSTQTPNWMLPPIMQFAMLISDPPLHVPFANHMSCCTQ